MDNSIKKTTSRVNRRNLLKTGLALAGGALLPAACTVPTKSASNQGASSSQKQLH
ncbi:MAG: twin-arginine translocation signal domain-containing protein [Chitinophagaceae bacterium]|nr:twin-arginine translocation signal domain-containing protein [Chitinophagaceae bacterium]